MIKIKEESVIVETKVYRYDIKEDTLVDILDNMFILCTEEGYEINTIRPVGDSFNVVDITFTKETEVE